MSDRLAEIEQRMSSDEPYGMPITAVWDYFDGHGNEHGIEGDLRWLISEVKRLRTTLQGIADLPDPLDSNRCYCRWSKGVAAQALNQPALVPATATTEARP